MKIQEIKKNLIELISKYLENPSSYKEKLYNFSWKVIDLYSNPDFVNKQPKEENEQEIWYTIWQIQHLLGEETTNENLNVFQEALLFLKGTVKIPKEYIGKRPLL